MFTVNKLNPSLFGVRWVGSKPYRQIRSYHDKEQAQAECNRLNRLIESGVPVSHIIPNHDMRAVTALGSTLSIQEWCKVLDITLSALSYHRKRRKLENNLLIPELLAEKGITSLDRPNPSPATISQRQTLLR